MFGHRTSLIKKQLQHPKWRRLWTVVSKAHPSSCPCHLVRPRYLPNSTSSWDQVINCQSLWQTCHVQTLASVCTRVRMTDTGTDTGTDTSLDGVFLQQQILPSVFSCIIGLDFQSSLQAGALVSEPKPPALSPGQVR